MFEIVSKIIAFFECFLTIVIKLVVIRVVVLEQTEEKLEKRREIN